MILTYIDATFIGNDTGCEDRYARGQNKLDEVHGNRDCSLSDGSESDLFILKN